MGTAVASAEAGLPTVVAHVLVRIGDSEVQTELGAFELPVALDRPVDPIVDSHAAVNAERVVEVPMGALAEALRAIAADLERLDS